MIGLTSLPLLIGMLSPIPGGAVVREAMMFVVAPGRGSRCRGGCCRSDLPHGAFGAIPILYAITGFGWRVAAKATQTCHNLRPYPYPIREGHVRE